MIPPRIVSCFQSEYLRSCVSASSSALTRKSQTFRSWKDARSGYEAAQQEKTIDTLKTLGLVFGAIIGLGLFSQVPIGQEDLQKYQDIKGSASRIDLGDLNN